MKALFIIAAFYGCMRLLGITCPILFMTGISCAGCGMTRAFLALLRLDFSAAWSYHPLFWLPVPAAFLYLYRRKIPKRWYRLGLCVMAAMFLAVYGVRMMDSQDTIVVCHPSDGVIWRAIAWFVSIGNIS